MGGTKRGIATRDRPAAHKQIGGASGSGDAERVDRRASGKITLARSRMPVGASSTEDRPRDASELAPLEPAAGVDQALGDAPPASDRGLAAIAARAPDGPRAGVVEVRDDVSTLPARGAR